MVMQHTLPAQTDAPARARALLEELLLPDRVRADAALLLSELVTNAVRHARQEETQPVRVTLQVRDGELRAEISDSGCSATLEPLEPDPTRPGGMGLMLVSQLASRWGQSHTPTTTVWFEMSYGTPRQAVSSRRPEPVLSASASLPAREDWEQENTCFLY
jgi:anti-sigma regulatory factor (Ser/Thr protein kinase)